MRCKGGDKSTALELKTESKTQSPTHHFKENQLEVTQSQLRGRRTVIHPTVTPQDTGELSGKHSPPPSRQTCSI